MNAQPDDPRPLQFETAVARTTESGDGQSVTCAACQRSILSEYYDVNGQSLCDGCRTQLTEHAETSKSWGVFARAGLFGLGATVLGAILYYAVIAITNFEIGIVAIAIGYMVGYAIRTATGGRGGLRFQILAVVLTYWAVGLAYTPLAVVGAANAEREQASAGTAQAGTEAPAQRVAETSVPQAGSGDDATVENVSAGRVIAWLAWFSFVLPLLVVFGSMPGGLISAAIIAFGMQQAWRLTGTLQLQISGPYQIGVRSPAS